jgi:methanogenic corrinoid protein MtbC1
VSTTTDLVEAIRAATRVMDVAAMEQVLDEAFAAERFETAVSHVVFPALRAIGDDWANGTIDVAMEHVVSETIRRRMARFFDAAAVPGVGFEVIVGLPPGGQHEIGALGFAVGARRRGLTVLYLGANVPVASWVMAAEATRARVAVIGVLGEPDVAAATETIDALVSSTSRLTVAVGGRAARRVADQEGVIILPDAMAPAIDVVRGLARGSPR